MTIARSSFSPELQKALHETPPAQLAAARFLDNHDERRMAISPAEYRAAILLLLGLLGCAFCMKARAEGCSSIPVQLDCRPNEPADPETSACSS